MACCKRESAQAVCNLAYVAENYADTTYPYPGQWPYYDEIQSTILFCRCWISDLVF